MEHVYLVSISQGGKARYVCAFSHKDTKCAVLQATRKPCGEDLFPSWTWQRQGMSIWLMSEWGQGQHC